MSDIVEFKTKKERAYEKLDDMFENGGDAEWAEFGRELFGAKPADKYKDLIEVMPTPEEIGEVIKKDKDHIEKRLEAAAERSKQKGLRIIKEPETIEEAINMNDEDFCELLKQQEIRGKVRK